MNKVTAWVALVVAGAGAYFWLSAPPDRAANTGPVIVPQLSALALEGKAVFEGTCAACHGANLSGTADGPPLLHAFYGPKRHGNRAIASAVQNGSSQHHWRFGAMPPQSHIAEEQVALLVPFIREMQVANGIE